MTKQKIPYNKIFKTLKRIPEPNNKYGYTMSFLIDILKPRALKAFSIWMRGQTMVLCEKTQDTVAYKCDFERWINQHIREGAKKFPEDQGFDWD